MLRLLANASTAYFDNINVTVHNGAGNIYLYGTDSVVYVDGTLLYRSGPVSHGVYASGNRTACMYSPRDLISSLSAFVFHEREHCPKSI
jgi:hypothetical protein